MIQKVTLMINSRLIKMAPSSLNYLSKGIVCKLIGLIAQIILAVCLSRLADSVYSGLPLSSNEIILLVISFVCFLTRIITNKKSVDFSFKSGLEIKPILRRELYDKLLRLGGSYKNKMSQDELTYLMSEGVDRLDYYFDTFLFHFAYTIFSALVLFIYLSRLCSNGALALMGAFVAFFIFYVIALKLSNDKDNPEFYINLAPALATCIGAGTAVILIINTVYKSKLVFADAVCFLLLIPVFFTPLKPLGLYMKQASELSASANKMFKFLDLPNPAPAQETMEHGPVEVLFKNVTFSYKLGDEFIRDIFINATPGKVIAIVGPSAAGKSTLGKLLSRKITGYGGSIKLNKHELKYVNSESIRKTITHVSPESYVFQGTIRDNLLMAYEDAEDKKLISALTIANLWPEIKDKDGLDLEVEKGGANLTAGQKQKLAFAKSLLKNCQVYIYDEPANKVDKKSQEMIISVIKKLAWSKGKVVFLITQKFANTIDADEILLMSKGRIIERGTHTELLRKNHAYAKLFKGQQILAKKKEGKKL